MLYFRVPSATLPATAMGGCYAMRCKLRNTVVDSAATGFYTPSALGARKSECAHSLARMPGLPHFGDRLSATCRRSVTYT